jgi:hypothetical protein
LAFDPPARVLLCWQLTAQFASDAELATEVEVRCIAETPTRPARASSGSTATSTASASMRSR